MGMNKYYQSRFIKGRVYRKGESWKCLHCEKVFKSEDINMKNRRLIECPFCSAGEFDLVPEKR